MRTILIWFAKLVGCYQEEPSKNEIIVENENPTFKNDSERLQDEWRLLDNENGALKLLIYDLDSYVWEKYKKNIVITMIYRTQEEQYDIYGPGYEKKSPHQFWQGVDIRSSTFTKEEIEDIIRYINEAYNDTNYYDWTARCHDVGRGDHFHFQYLEVA